MLYASFRRSANADREEESFSAGLQSRESASQGFDLICDRTRSSTKEYDGNSLEW